ncbi:MAG: hypothetical protein KBA06_01000, partial [Saprospiraceae bacterium]|nr:hypothetical protein [Saprospiraceae bacterium]
MSFAQNWDINTLRNINVNRNEKWDNFNIFMSKSAPYIALGFPIAEGGISLFTKNPTTQWKALELGTSIGITVGLTYITKHV